MDFNGSGNVSIAWGSEVDNLRGLAQKVAAGALTQAGTDELVPDRGTNALKQILSAGAYDLMAIQHSLNFAALKTATDVRAFEAAADPTYTLSSVQMQLIGIANGTVQVSIAVAAASGESTRTITEIV
jgi:hypothetical protein